MLFMPKNAAMNPNGSYYISKGISEKAALEKWRVGKRDPHKNNGNNGKCLNSAPLLVAFISSI